MGNAPQWPTMDKHLSATTLEPDLPSAQCACVCAFFQPFISDDDDTQCVRQFREYYSRATGLSVEKPQCATDLPCNETNENKHDFDLKKK